LFVSSLNSLLKKKEKKRKEKKRKNQYKFASPLKVGMLPESKLLFNVLLI